MKKSSTHTNKIKRGLKLMLMALALFLFTGINKVKAQSPYCDPYYTYNCSQYYMSINALEISQGSTTLYSRSHTSGGLNGCTASSGYYTLWSSSSMFTLKANGTYKFGFTTGPTYSVNVGIWIDLNGDKDFADANEMLPVPACVYGTGNVQAGTSSLTYYNVKIPAGITPGVTRMRIRSNYYYSTCWNSGDNGCTSLYYGEAEDFTITLASDPNDAGISAITAPMCSPKLKATISNYGNNDINPVQVGWSVNGSLQTSNSYSSTIAKNGGTADITLTPDYNFVDGTVYTVKVFTYSPNNTTDPDKTNDTLVSKFKYIGPAGTPTTYDTKRCGPGKTMMKATTPFQSDSVTWYNDSIAGSVVGKGKNCMSPQLYLGVNKFWAQSFKMSAPSSLINAMNGNTILSGSAAYNGTMVDITPNTDIVIDSFVIHLYYSTPGSTSEVWYRTGSYSGHENSSSGWTKVQDGVMRVDASGAKYFGYIKLNELALKKGQTYGFYITCTSTTGNDLYANYGNATISNSDLSVYGGSFIYGQFASNGVYAPYNPDLGTYYRTSTCPSNRVPIKITVNPAPNGAAFTKSTPFQTTQPNTNGFIGNPDIVAESDQLTYELQPPTGYSNSGHGSTWLTLTPVVKSKNGTDIPSGSIWTWTAPSGSTPGKLIFKPTKSMTDTLYVVSMQLKDLGPYYCDSTINRYIFVAPRPNPDFKFNQPVCDGDAVLFDNLSTISTGGLKYRWDMGTGNAADTSDAYSLVFTFPTYGVYNVTLKTTSLPYGYVESKTISVVVTEIPKIGFKVLNACENVPITFNNTTTIGA
ncbi:MAG: hypothetical protein HUU47_08310, partial [Bacteroidetes bacterium]|nr:hypothetical protein [Bacteroidota bacterium]